MHYLLLFFLATTMMAQPSLYDFTMKDIDGKDVNLSAYKGKVVLVVNVASFCGFTKQYAPLEKLYNEYKDQGFVILGFPSNDFGAQEPGTDTEIKEFCSTKYSVTFPMFSKITVKGANKHPLYAWLTTGISNESLKGEVGWNFEKFLIGPDGKIVNRYATNVEPMEGPLKSDVAKLVTDR